jgi:hypothetical protein
VIDGVTVAARRDPWRHRVGLFADAGIVGGDDPPAALRELLALNARGDFAPVRFGVHPVSHRAVAALSVSLALVGAGVAQGADVLARVAQAAALLRGPG